MIKYNSKQRRNTHLYFYMFIYLYFCASIFIDIYIYNKKTPVHHCSGENVRCMYRKIFMQLFVF